MLEIQDISIPDVDNIIGQQLVTKLNGLGIFGIKIEAPIVGPIITGFPIKFKHQVSLKKFKNLEEDLALACAVDSVEIKRIGGRLIIFIPNKEKTIVDFKDALSWFLKDKNVAEMRLPIL